jgi:hypothetical protein
MANDGTGTLWDDTDPADGALVSDGAKQIRDIRKGVKIRVDKEHEAYGTASAGGEHKAGSAKVYYGGAAPANRPDGATALGAGDAGRLWIDGTIVKVWSGAAWVAATGVVAGLATAVLKHERPQGSGGGSMTIGAWRTRVLNAENDPSGIVTLAANQFTLAAGTYFINALLNAYRVNSNTSRLQNITDGSTTLLGTGEMATNHSNASSTKSSIMGTFTIAGAKAFECQQRCETTNATDGFGRAIGGWGVDEIHAVVQLIKLS